MTEIGWKERFRFFWQSLRKNNWWLLPLLLGVLVRAEYLREFSTSPLFSLALGADVAEYDLRAREILGGMWFPLQTEIHAPLYSFFLAGIYRCFPDNPVPAARIVQLLLAFPASFVLAAELRRGGLSKALCGWFLAGMLLLPNLIFFQAELISESLLFPLLTLALAFLLRFRRTGGVPSGIAGSLLCGLAVLTHGLAIGFVAAGSIAALRQKKWKQLLLLLTGVLIIVLPVVTAKSIHYGRVTGVQENGAFNLWLGNNPKARGFCYLPPGQEWRTLHREAGLEAKTRQVSVNRVWLEKTCRFWKERPGKALSLFGRKAVYFFAPNELSSGSDVGTLVCWTDLVLWGRFVIPAVFLLAFLGLWDFVRKRKSQYLPAFLLVASFWFCAILTVTSGRYRMGAWPGILIFAALGIGTLNWKRWWSLPVLAIFLTAPFSFSFMAAGQRDAATLQGEAALQRGDLDPASDFLTYASRKRKDPALFFNLLGGIAEQQGDLIQAEKWYKDAAETEPLHPAGWMNLGILYGRKGRYPEAEQSFERAMRQGDNPALAAYNYGLLQLHRGKPEEAKRLETLAVRNAPTDPKIWNALGTADYVLRDYEGAKIAFRRAASLAPHHSGYAANVNAAEAAIRAGRQIK